MSKHQWIETTLQELAAKADRAFAMGPFGSNIKAENYRESGVPVLRGTNLGEVGDAPFWADEFVFLDEAKADELKSSNCAPNDIVFVAQGTVGKVGIIPTNTPYNRFVLSQNLMKVTVDPKRADPRYVYYFYRSSIGQHEIMSRVNPTGVPCISKPLASLRQFGIRIPTDVDEQRAIAYILGTLDNKIELNRRQNETLEAMARALFKSWFVDFDLVRAKAEGRDIDLPEHIAGLFSSAFNDSELGDIPMGWSVGKLGDVLKQRVERCVPSSETATRPYVPIECITSKSLFLEDSKPGIEAQSSLAQFYKGDLLFGAMRPYFHKVCIAPFDGTTRTTAFVLSPRIQADFAFATLLLHHPNTIDYVTRHSTGSTIPYAMWSGSMEEMPVVLPPPGIRSAFNNIVFSLLERIPVPHFQNKTLVGLRDTLLPKLLSGELRIPDAKKLIERLM